MEGPISSVMHYAVIHDATYMINTFLMSVELILLYTTRIGPQEPKVNSVNVFAIDSLLYLCHRVMKTLCMLYRVMITLFTP